MSISKRWECPPGCSIHDFTLRELTVRDDAEIATWVERHTNQAALKSNSGKISAEQREAIRMALVSVDGVPVNVDGVPFVEMNKWSLRTYMFVWKCFQDLNGIDIEEADKFFLQGEVTMKSQKLAALPPTFESKQSAG